MYSTMLILHNLLRWGVLLGGLYAITKSVLGMMRNRDFTVAENRAHAIFVAFCHTQLVLGLILYAISPVVQAAWADMATAMQNKQLRMMSVEHITINIIAIALIQTGRILSKKATDARIKHKRAVIWFSIGLILILSRIPWQFSPLFRF